MEGFVVFLILLLFIIVPIACLVNTIKKKRAEEARIRALALSDIDNMDGVAFEHYVVRLLRHEGYTKVEVSNGSGYFGIDTVASKDRRRYAIQVKRWSGTISRTAVSDAVAGQRHYSCNAAMVITNSYLSVKSREFAASVGCEIVDRDTLAEWILRFQGAGGAVQTVLPVVVAPAPMAPLRIRPGLPLQSPSDRIAAESKVPILAVAVPPDILASIKKMAASDHPRDFSTQAYVINEQIEAYGKLQKFRPGGIPESVLVEIMSQAAQDHPSDYSIQICVLEDHVKAYFALAGLKADGVPFETFAAIKEDAERDHPGDFSTQLYVINDQIESFKALGQLG
jgi:hypothetical protein